MKSMEIKVDEDVRLAWEKIVLSKTATWMLFTIQDDGGIERVKVHSQGMEGPEGFCAMIHEKIEFEPCYGIVSVGGKVCFVSWKPDAGKMLAKLKYENTEVAVVAAVQGGISAKLLATDPSELTITFDVTVGSLV